MKIKTYFFILALSSILPIFAQTNNSLDEKYTPSGSATFGSGKKEDKPTENNIQPNFAFRIPLLELFRNEFRLLIERKISDGNALEFGIGVSYSNDLINTFNSTNMAKLWGDEKTYLRLPLYTMLSNCDFEPGIIFSLAFRHYYAKRKLPSFFDLTVRNVTKNGTLTGLNIPQPYFTYNNTFISANFGISFGTHNSKSRFANSFSLGLGAQIGVWDEFVNKNHQIGYSSYLKSGNNKVGINPFLSIKFNVSVVDLIKLSGLNYGNHGQYDRRNGRTRRY